MHKVAMHIAETWARKIEVEVTDEQVDEYLAGAGAFWRNYPRERQVRAYAVAMFDEEVWRHPDEREPFFSYPNIDEAIKDGTAEIASIEADFAEIKEEN